MVPFERDRHAVYAGLAFPQKGARLPTHLIGENSMGLKLGIIRLIYSDLL